MTNRSAAVVGAVVSDGGANSPHWVVAVVEETLAREENTDAHKLQQLTTRAALVRAVTVHGMRWMQRLEADLRSAAAIVNTRAGRRLLDVHFSAASVITIQGGSQGYLMFAWDLRTEAHDTPGVMVSLQRTGGAGGASPYAFELGEEDLLALRCLGELAGPERFSKLMLQPFLATLTLGGR
jgi:hypothetical protein